MSDTPTKILQDGTPVYDDPFAITRDPVTGNVSIGGEVVIYNRDRNPLAGDPPLETAEAPPQEPEPLPTPSPEAIAGYRARSEDSDFEIIREQMRSYASRLPESEVEKLTTNEEVFNELYDRTAKAYRAHVQAVREAEEIAVLPDHVQRMILESREVKRKEAEAAQPVPEENPSNRYRALLERAQKSEKLHRHNNRAPPLSAFLLAYPRSCARGRAHSCTQRRKTWPCQVAL